MITPSDSASAPGQYAAVPVSGVNIQAGNDEAALTSAFAASNADAGAGVLYPASERQAQAKALITSAPGFALDGYDIDAGTNCGWPNNVEPGG